MIKRKEKQFRGTRCLNCDTALDISEKYCHQCGQLNSTKKLSIADFFEEFLSNFYAYDSRLRNSILSIFTKPGVLAKEYNEGKRQKYANPFRLFLSVSIVLFITFNFNSTEQTKTNKKDNTEPISEEEALKKEKDSIALDFLNLKVKEKGVDKYIIKPSKDSIYTQDYLNKNFKSDYKPFTYRITSFRNYALKYPEKTEENCFKELGYDNNQINKFLYSKSKLFKTNDILEEFLDFFYQKLPFLIFLSLPIITIIFWLLYFRKKINYTEHLVFSYTYFTFLFICMILFNLISLFSESLSSTLIGLSFCILFPIYLYKSLRNFYQQSRWKTILKFVILNPLFALFLIISASLMMLIGILLF